MHEETALIALVAMAFVLACAFGLSRTRARLRRSSVICSLVWP
jgi:nucleoside permease NupC